ncbi:AbrB/MazE/SpoVT family DNA-binding domain-containing protein [Actinopolymorpha pittospori]|uniref:AbrB family looped-hinge helix DNA binding protein n=1 Tax=Actinopolymorpha pittospori TaxID=648752 RepID=A0A927RG73_9ACTN|nr:AbrB/MazE/SpoVT family DNA-binding domain-containing protein [Actinopolymorpha pittospori]MBE1603961.1 AbrB family looped-hinge helix DNA binding protein [Actinopolymorpha pittospori]
METHVGFATVQPKNGTITIPAQLRRQFGLDKPGAQVEIVVRDGVIVLVPHVAIPADQAWFWSPEWQAKEREADQDLAAGEYTEHETGDDFLAHLDRLAEDGAGA